MKTRATKNSTTFLNALRKKYKNLNFKFVRFSDQLGKKETIAIDDKQINLAWMPRLDDISDAGALEVLFKDCQKSIEEHIDENNLEST